VVIIKKSGFINFAVLKKIFYLAINPPNPTKHYTSNAMENWEAKA